MKAQFPTDLDLDGLPPLVAFDTETSGKYPLESEICEIAAVKWSGASKPITSVSSLIKVSRPMSEEVIGIHGITNEMLNDAPSMSAVLGEFLEFIDGCLVVAHHAPFDLGFLGVELYRHQLSWPQSHFLCSSLLARRLIPQAPNHRLQTLVKYLNLTDGQAHRATSDALQCLELTMNCLARLGTRPTLERIIQAQGGVLEPSGFSIDEFLKRPFAAKLMAAILAAESVEFSYSGGSRPGQARTIAPIGLVLNGSSASSFLVACEPPDKLVKRYLIDRILDVKKDA